eukprot:CAMPEP_0113565400 /NCGR_PEP_ID=MMETSP0015_2-20120614/22156_1 /TAXON_ID=2838 /ORGANISM="Odontella" /LENGTH=117 /DNA_ID=CAMNT_0000467593 /DNA_START=83 /DNA_END=432 /DNA_ORIENTATION=+ /assembly_acc=CAM_ASM_000160
MSSLFGRIPSLARARSGRSEASSAAAGPGGPDRNERADEGGYDSSSGAAAEPSADNRNDSSFATGATDDTANDESFETQGGGDGDGDGDGGEEVEMTLDDSLLPSRRGGGNFDDAFT